MAMAQRKAAYHHGDLRRALVAVALDRVRRDGAEAFSLREAARDVGVTSGAAYKHFADRDALLGATAAEGFKLLAARTQRATAGLNAEERLAASGRAYIDFASDEPRLFKLMFSRFGAWQECDTGAARAAGPHEPDAPPPAFEQLRQAVAEVTRVAPEAVDPDLLAAAWSLVHGAASLITDGVWTKRDPRAAAALRASRRLFAPAPAARSESRKR